MGDTTHPIRACDTCCTTVTTGVVVTNNYVSGNVQKEHKKKENSRQRFNQATIKAEPICMVTSTLANSKKNLKKMNKIYDALNLIDPKEEFKENNGKPQLMEIYYQVWFMFMDEIIHIQKTLINCSCKGKIEPLLVKEIMDKMDLLIQPIPVQFLKYKPPQIKLFIPPNVEHIFNLKSNH